MAKSHIETIARGVIISGDALLICRNRKRGHLFLPGGHVEFGEPAAVALRRELIEELGVELPVGGLIGVVEAAFDQPHKKDGQRRHHEINLVFDVALADHDPTSLESAEDKIAFDWIRFDDLRQGAIELLPTGVTPMLLHHHQLMAEHIANTIAPLVSSFPPAGNV